MVTIAYRWASGHEGELPTRTRWRHDNDPDVQPGAFYLCFARGSKAIYCGCTIDPARRFATHARKPWWPEVKRIEVVWYPDQVDARIAEARVHEQGRLKYSKEVPWWRYRSDYVPSPGSPSRSEARARTAAYRRVQAELTSGEAAGGSVDR
jgi:predicted GIY-YIG superfamily endonuclease